MVIQQEYFDKKIADKWKIPIIEDAAEALGSWILNSNKKIHCGLIGDLGVISFNGNKIITTGGGGALITNNKKLAELARYLSTTAKKDHKWEFYHDKIGWNDRMPNLNAALGLAQMEHLIEFIKNKKLLHERISKAFSNIKNVKILDFKNNNLNNNWLIH